MLNDFSNNLINESSELMIENNEISQLSGLYDDVTGSQIDETIFDKSKELSNKELNL